MSKNDFYDIVSKKYYVEKVFHTLFIQSLRKIYLSNLIKHGSKYMDICNMTIMLSKKNYKFSYGKYT